MIEKKYITKIFSLFLAAHLFIWTLIPSIVNENLPLDTIEALAWGSNLDWGFNKHPPFSAFAVEFVYQIFGNQDWAYYLLSQIFVIVAFISVFFLAKDFFNNSYLALISVLILEGLFFYNYTSPEFNVNISQLPFWALSIFLTWRCIQHDKVKDYFFLGLIIGLGFLSKYLFLYLILSIKLLFIYLLIQKKIKSYNFLLIAPVSLFIISPHLIWLSNNEFVTLTYGLQRTNIEGYFINHIIYPINFILKQIGILLLPLLMAYFFLKKVKFKKKLARDKTLFIIFTFLMPILLMLLTSIVIGAKIRTMWMTPFYLLLGIAIIHIFDIDLSRKKFKAFSIIFLFLFLLSPTTYAIVSIKNDFKRTDFQGKEIARLVQNKWDDNFSNEIGLVIGDEWYAGNLSYHLQSRPKWTSELKKEINNESFNLGVIYTGNPKILKNICPGAYGTIKPVGYCMIGRK